MLKYLILVITIFDLFDCSSQTEIEPIPVVSVLDTSVIRFAETMPSFIGGTDSLNSLFDQYFKNPDCNGKPLKTEITVNVKFVVNTLGKLEKIETKELESEVPKCYLDQAINLIKLTDGRWIPGTQGGKKVKVMCIMPVIFSTE